MWGEVDRGGGTVELLQKDSLRVMCLYNFSATRWGSSFCLCGAVSSGRFSFVVVVYLLDLLRDQALM